MSNNSQYDRHCAKKFRDSGERADDRMVADGGIFVFVESNLPMADWTKKMRFLPLIIIGAAIFGIGYLGREPYRAVATINDLLTENRKLKQALTSLTDEDQIGYAKVISQQFKDGQILTTIKFVETARGNKLKTILEKEYTIIGDIIYFDALIVKFGNKMVTDGKSRALYLWRRVYGERMSPAEGFPIEEPGTEPKRYKDLLDSLPIEKRRMFWSSIWDLANDHEKLAAHGIEAIYGNAVYTKLRTGLIYVFKIDSTGQVCPEVVPDI